MIRAPDPNQLLKSTPFSPPPFFHVPDEPKPLQKLVFRPKTTLFNPLKDVWTGQVKDMPVNFTP